MGRATASMRQGQIQNHLPPRWGDIPLDRLNSVELETWLAGLDLANQTKKHMPYSMQIITREAYRERVVPFDPLAAAEPTGNEWRRRVTLTPRETTALFPPDHEQLLAVWGEARRAMAYQLMYSTGMRVGEVCAVQWRHMNLRAGTEPIEQAAKADGSIGPPKNEQARSAWFEDSIVDLLRWWRGKTPQAGRVDFLIHGTESGRHVDPKLVQRAWGPAAEAAKFRTAGRFLGAQALRYTHETRLRNKVPEHT